MASLSMSLEDSSPLITYSAGWAEQEKDVLVQDYSGASLHRSTQIGSTATIQFTGTQISIFGGMRPGYGTYSFAVDGKVVSTGNAGKQPSEPEQLKMMLAEAKDLAPGVPHTAVFTHEGGSAIDLDFVSFTDVVGPAGSTSVNALKIDDADPRISYGPNAAEWRVNTLPALGDGTIHITDQPAATANLKFTGDAVAIYSAMSPDHSNVKIMLDGKEVTVPGGKDIVNGVHPQTLIYYANGLGNKEHDLTIASDGTGGGAFLDVDSIMTYTGAGGPGGVAPLSNNDANANNLGAPGTGLSENSSPIPGKTLAPFNAAPIIGGAIGGVLGLLLILGAVFFFLSRRRRNARNERIMSPKTPALPMQFGPRDLEYGAARREKLTEANSYLNEKSGMDAQTRHSRNASTESFGTFGSEDAMLAKGQGGPPMMAGDAISFPAPVTRGPGKDPNGSVSSFGEEITRVPTRPARRPSLRLAID